MESFAIIINLLEGSHFFFGQKKDPIENIFFFLFLKKKD